ncbi:MAG: hypothetical protein ACM3MI_00315 [Clostridiales bacterium]
MRISNQIVRLFSLYIALFLTSCKSNPVDPIDPPKNPSEYQWTADTLAINDDEIQCLMESIWGTSTNNMYTCGHTASHINNFFHYDGNKWKVIDIPANIKGTLSFRYVSGTSANDIWALGWGTEPALFHFDGANWTLDTR